MLSEISLLNKDYYYKLSLPFPFGIIDEDWKMKDFHERQEYWLIIGHKFFL